MQSREKESVKKVASLFVLLLLVSVVPVSLPQIGVANAEGTIYIRADGSVEGTGNILRYGDTYTFTGNIAGSIVVERDSIVLDGVGYTLHGTGNGTGVTLASRHNVRVKNISINAFGTGIAIAPNMVQLGVPSRDSSGNLVSGNTITDTACGIRLGEASNNNTVSGNVIANSTYGIHVSGGLYELVFTEKNEIRGNTITDSEFGIYINYAKDNLLRNNHMSDNQYNFMIGGKATLADQPQFFANDVDGSNTVDGKPICYWVNQQGGVVPSDAGYVALIDCSGVMVQNLDLTSNGQGIFVYSTTDSLIVRNNIVNNCDDGVFLLVSHNISVTENNIENNTQGILMDGSGSNIISGNNITNNRENGINIFDSQDATVTGNNVTGNNDCGIRIWYQSDNAFISANCLANNSIGIQIDNSIANNITGNTITGNSDSGIRLWNSNSTIVRNAITDNGDGISVYSCSNAIYHNDFVNNTVQAYTDGSICSWDKGSEGNYWSNYNCTDTDGDGISDTPHIIDYSNQDKHPLMEPCIIPEFPSWTPLLITLVAVVAITFVYRHKLKKQRRFDDI
jgi:parallel beta-helix repeat protein